MICRNCGHKAIQDHSFCIKCGTPLYNRNNDENIDIEIDASIKNNSSNPETGSVFKTNLPLNTNKEQLKRTLLITIILLISIPSFLFFIVIKHKVEFGTQTICSLCGNIIESYIKTKLVSMGGKGNIVNKYEVCEKCLNEEVSVETGKIYTCSICGKTINESIKTIKAARRDVEKYKIVTEPSVLCQEHEEEVIEVTYGKQYQCEKCEYLIKDSTKNVNITRGEYFNNKEKYLTEIIRKGYCHEHMDIDYNNYPKLEINCNAEISIDEKILIFGDSNLPFNSEINVRQKIKNGYQTYAANSAYVLKDSTFETYLNPPSYELDPDKYEISCYYTPWHGGDREEKLFGAKGEKIGKIGLRSKNKCKIHFPKKDDYLNLTTIECITPLEYSKEYETKLRKLNDERIANEKTERIMIMAGKDSIGVGVDYAMYDANGEYAWTNGVLTLQVYEKNNKLIKSKTFDVHTYDKDPLLGISKISSELHIHLEYFEKSKAYYIIGILKTEGKRTITTKSEIEDEN